MGISTNKKASQLVNYKTCKPINLHEKQTRKTSTKLLGFLWGWRIVIGKIEGLLLDFTSTIYICSLLQDILGDRRFMEYKARKSI